MKKSIKIALIVATVCMLIGILLFGVAYTLGARPEQIWKDDSLRIPWFISIGSSSSTAGYSAWSTPVSPDGSYTLSGEDMDGLDIQ